MAQSKMQSPFEEVLADTNFSNETLQLWRKQYEDAFAAAGVAHQKGEPQRQFTVRRPHWSGAPHALASRTLGKCGLPFNLVEIVLQMIVEEPLCRRHYAINFMALLVDRLEMPTASLAKSVLLLDLFYHRTNKFDEDIALLPGVCTAICHLLYKADNAWAAPQTANLSQAANCFVEQLRGATLIPEDGPMWWRQLEQVRPLHIMEKRVLPVIGWFINYTTAEQWLVAYGARFNDLTRCHFRNWMQGISQSDVAIAHESLHLVLTVDLEPSRLAIYMLCNIFVSRGLLSMAWICTNGAPQAPPCAIPLQTQQAIFEFVLVATGRSLDELQTEYQECKKTLRSCQTLVAASSGALSAPATPAAAS